MSILEIVEKREIKIEHYIGHLISMVYKISQYINLKSAIGMKHQNERYITYHYMIHLEMAIMKH